MMVADVVVAKNSSHRWVVTKISVTNGCSHVTIAKKNPGNFLATRIWWGNLLSGKFLCCYGNYPGSWGIHGML